MTKTKLLELNLIRPKIKGLFKGTYEYVANDGMFTVAPNEAEAIKRANEAFDIYAKSQNKNKLYHKKIQILKNKNKL